VRWCQTASSASAKVEEYLQNQEVEVFNNRTDLFGVSGMKVAMMVAQIECVGLPTTLAGSVPTAPRHSRSGRRGIRTLLFYEKWGFVSKNYRGLDTFEL
jgi:hypothetical protein